METTELQKRKHQKRKQKNQLSKNKNIDLIKENEETTLQLEEVKVLNKHLVKDLNKMLVEGVNIEKKASRLKRKYGKSSDSANDSVRQLSGT